MRAMPSRLMTEWIAFFKIEAEEINQQSLIQQASSGLREMK
jgi:hypothetical protein